MLTAVGWGPLVGYKIGCTTPVMQQYLGIENPCAGGVFAGSMHTSGVALDPSAFLRVGVECEIAVRLERDLPLSDAPFTTEGVSQAIASYMAAIEIVDDRYVDWRQTDTPTLIADDFFAAGCVLGCVGPWEPPAEMPRSLAGVWGRIRDAAHGRAELNLIARHGCRHRHHRRN